MLIDEVQNISLDVKLIERPWCSHCEENSAYINSTNSVQRADLDGRSYSEVIEIRKCKKCDNEMVFIKDFQYFILGINLVCLLIWLSMSMVWIYLLPFQAYLLIGIFFNTLIVCLIRLFTRKHRGVVSKWKKWYEFEKIMKNNSNL
jgi:hypothetical protein